MTKEDLNAELANKIVTDPLVKFHYGQEVIDILIREALDAKDAAHKAELGQINSFAEGGKQFLSMQSELMNTHLKISDLECRLTLMIKRAEEAESMLDWAKKELTTLTAERDAEIKRARTAEKELAALQNEILSHDAATLTKQQEIAALKADNERLQKERNHEVQKHAGTVGSFLKLVDRVRELEAAQAPTAPTDEQLERIADDIMRLIFPIQSSANYHPGKWANKLIVDALKRAGSGGV